MSAVEPNGRILVYMGFKLKKEDLFGILLYMDFG